jgi:putative ABC transport system permease protein
MSAAATRSRMRLGDVVRSGSVGLRSRRVRAALSALGVAIGIAAMVAVLGVSASQESALLDQLDKLGTNLLALAPGQTIFGHNAELPANSAAMVGRLDGVQAVSATGGVSAPVYRSDHVPASETNGISTVAARLDLLSTVQGHVAVGRWLNAATERYPAVVLGSVTAQRLGISSVSPATQVWLGGHWFTVVGILDSLPLEPELDRSALVGDDVAASLLGWDRAPTRVYVRAVPEQTAAVQALLGVAANPQHPEQVNVSRPSDALAARVATQGAFTSLFLGLGAVALLVGGIGIGNVMVISVLERRGEVGLRRALGAARRHVAGQFVTEAVLLSALGGVGGAVLGALATAGYAIQAGTTVVIPPLALAGGVAAAVLIGAVAGLYPALRAASLSPTEALRGT